MMRDAFFQFLPPLPLPSEMPQWDAASIALGLPEMLLMENAARAALAVLEQHAGPLKGKKAVLYMGSGNNGGDAACLARHLLDAQACPVVLHTRALGKYRGAAARHLRLARAAGVTFLPMQRRGKLAADADILVDGLLGTGFSGMLRSGLQELVQEINAHAARSFVLALDIPSGLDGRTGRPSPLAVQADVTVSFAAAKPGLLLPEARRWVGLLEVRPIGIPAVVQEKSPCSAYLLDGRCLSALPTQPEGCYKNSFGHVLIMGGAPGLGGAAHLAARAALRSGAGLVTAAAPGTGLADIKNGWAEIMTLGLSADAQWPVTVPEHCLEAVSRAAALVLGPGMGRSEAAADFLAAVLALPQRPPAVLDADALILLARRPALLHSLRREDVLTPHPGEAASLLGCSTATVQGDRFTALAGLCTLSAAVAVLKGAGTLVGQAGSPVLLSPYDVPQMAMGGSGDVLAGCVGGLLAQRAALTAQSSLALAGMAVVWHVLAGRHCAGLYPLRGNKASELADALPAVRASLLASDADVTVPTSLTGVLPWPR